MVGQKSRTINKLPTQLTVEELQLIAAKADSVVSEEVDPFLLFISTFNITSGKYRVHTSILNKLYNAWATEPLNSKTFGLRMSKFFKNVNTFYLLSSSTRNFLLAIETYKKKRSKRTKTNLEVCKNMVEEWMTIYSVRAGGTWVSSHILFYLYKRHWCSKKKTDYTSLRIFSNLLKLYFPYKHTHNYGLSFKIHDSVRNALTAKELEQLREGWERTSAKKKKSSQ